MLNAVFLSDIHLTTLNDQRGRLFLRALMSFRGVKTVTGAVNAIPSTMGSQPISHLFFVGDIFDLWLADHDFFLQTYATAIDQVRRLRSEGVEIHYFEGNHDLYLKKFWSRKLGVKVHSGPSYFQLGKYRTRVEHGDQMDPDDRGYRFLRWLLRTKFVTRLAHKLPAKWVVKLGRFMSKKSRTYTSKVKTISQETAVSKLHKHAEKIAGGEPYDLLIHGHVHVKDDYQFTKSKPRRSINLGSWLGDQTEYLQVTDDEIKFVAAT